MVGQVGDEIRVVIAESIVEGFQRAALFEQTFNSVTDIVDLNEVL
jgi:hypothetical protein